MGEDLRSVAASPGGHALTIKNNSLLERSMISQITHTHYAMILRCQDLVPMSQVILIYSI